MDDEWIVGRPSFRFEEPPHRGRIERVHAKAVHRLGREGDEAAAAQALRGARDRSRRRVE
jgi:hypothetical protein